MLTSRIVEDTGGRMFGLEEQEVMSRRKYVDHARAEIEVSARTVFHLCVVDH